MKKEYVLDWNEYIIQCYLLNNKIKEKFDLIIGIHKGGLIPATICAYARKTPLATIAIQRYKDKEESEIKWSKDIATLQEIKGEILIVDDITDKGETLIKAKELIEAKSVNSYNIKIATVYYKLTSIIKPDYYLGETDEWIVFPYEQ